MKGNKNKSHCVNNYCQTNHIINEHLKCEREKTYLKVQKCLFLENTCLENKNLFNYQKWF